MRVHPMHRIEKDIPYVLNPRYLKDRTEHHKEVHVSFLIRMCELSAVCSALLELEGRCVRCLKEHFTSSAILSSVLCLHVIRCLAMPFSIPAAVWNMPRITDYSELSSNGLSDDISYFNNLQESLAFSNCSWRLIKLVQKKCTYWVALMIHPLISQQNWLKNIRYRFLKANCLKIYIYIYPFYQCPVC